MNNTMNRKEFLDLVAKEAGLYKYQSKRFFDAFAKVLIELLEEGTEVKLFKFGKFYLRELDGYVTTNPQNHKDKVLVPARKKIVFKPSIVIKRDVNGCALSENDNEEDDDCI